MSEAQQFKEMISENPYFKNAVQKAIIEILHRGEETKKKNTLSATSMPNPDESVEKLHRGEETENKNTLSATPMPNLDEIAKHVIIDGYFPETLSIAINQTDEEIQSSVLKVDKVDKSTDSEQESEHHGSASVAIDPTNAEVKGSKDARSKCISKVEKNTTTTKNPNAVPAKHKRSLRSGTKCESIKRQISAPASLEVCLDLENPYHKAIKYGAIGIAAGVGICAIPLLAAVGVIPASVPVIGGLVAKCAGLGLAKVSIGSGVVTAVGGAMGCGIGYYTAKTVTLTMEDVFKYLEGYKKKGDEVFATIKVQHATEVNMESITPIPPTNNSPGEASEQGQPRKRHRKLHRKIHRKRRRYILE